MYALEYAMVIVDLVWSFEDAVTAKVQHVELR